MAGKAASEQTPHCSCKALITIPKHLEATSRTIPNNAIQMSVDRPIRVMCISLDSTLQTRFAGFDLSNAVPIGKRLAVRL